MFKVNSRLPSGSFGIRPVHSSLPRLVFKPTSPPVSSEVAHKQSSGGPNYQYDKHPILKRIPRFLRPYTTQFITAPVSHVTAFIVLHEITAIVPLIGIWYVLHEHHDTFMLSSLDLPAWAIEKGTKIIDKAMVDWDFGDYSISEKYQFIKEGAYAYVIVKTLFPIRLAISLLGMPWFARWFVLPITRLFARSKKTKSGSANISNADESAIKEHVAKQNHKPRL